MNILEFIETHYPIKEKIRGRLEDPYARIANMDNLPYDKIGPDECGTITKLVEVDDNRYVSVMDLIAMSEDEVRESKDEALIIAYTNYMGLVDIEDMNISDIMECVRQYKGLASKRKGQLDVLSV